MKNTRLLKKILLLACVLVMLVNSLSAFAETVGDTGAAEPPAAAEAAAAEDAFAEEPAPAEDTRQEEAEPAPQAEEINASLPESEQFTAQAAPAAADAAPQAQAEDDAIDLQPAESNSAVFGIAVTQSSKLLPFRFSESGRYASILVEGTYKKNQDPSVVKASPQGTGTLTVLEAWQVLNVKNNADLTLTATLDALPDTLGEAETLSFYALMDGRLDSTALQADIDVGDQTALDLAHKGADGIALVKQAADADDLPTDGTVIWANDDVYLTGKMPKNAIVVAEPVPVEVNGEFVLAAYDIRIYNNANKLAKGQTWQPAGDKVQVHFRDKAFKAGDQVNIYHRAAESGAFEKVDTVTAEDAMVTFEAGSFSVYAATVLEKTVEAKNGDIYRITATYDKQSGIPADAELRAAEIEVDNASYERYLRQTADALHVDVRSVAYSRLFDISIVGKDGTVYQPNDAVSVTIELLNADARSVESMRVVHFGSDESEQKGQSVENADAAAKELTAQTNGRAVTFSTDGFSVFSLIDTSVISRVVNAIFGAGNDKLYENDDIILTGNMPLLGTVEASPVTVEIDGQPSLLGYDIKIYANSLMKLLGIAWQPSEGALQVTMKSDNLTVNAVDVYHMETASSAAELVTENIAVSENSVTFDAGKFSVYVIVKTVLEKTISTPDGLDYKITVSYDSDSGLPEGVDLDVKVLENPDAYLETAKTALNTEKASIIKAFDISIVDEEGKHWQPTKDVLVTIELTGTELNTPRIVHIPDEGEAEGIVPSVSGELLSFQSDSFSVYVVAQVVLDDTISASDGNTYLVSVTFDTRSGIPENAKLSVHEILPETEEYAAYFTQSQEHLGKVLDDAKIFDIQIVDDLENPSVVYEPMEGYPVDVSIQLMEKPAYYEIATAHIVHIGKDGPEQLENTATAIDGGYEYSFTASSLSPVVVGYTVDFHFGEYDYSMAGESTLLLSELFEKLGITDISVARVTDVTFSDPSLLAVEKVLDPDQIPAGADYIEGDWLLISLEPFETEELLTITLSNGQSFTIDVTDAYHGIEVTGSELTAFASQMDLTGITVRDLRAITANVTYDDAFNVGTGSGAVFIRWNGTLPKAENASTGVKRINGSITFTYPNGAYDSDNNNCDVVFTLSDIRLYGDTRTAVTGNFRIASAKQGNHGLPDIGTGIDDAQCAITSVTNPRYGMEARAEIKIVDRATGSIVPESFVVTVWDVNVNRETTASFANIWDASAHHNFSEYVRMSGDVYYVGGSNSYMKTVGNDILPKNNGGSNSYNTGVATVARNGSYQFTVFNGGGGSGITQNYYMMPRQGISHTITSYSGFGGSIETSTTGSFDGTEYQILPGGTVTHPKTYEVPAGKNVTYRFKPDTGYTLNKLYVQDGSGAPQAVDTSSMAADAEGWYSYTFTNVSTTRKINVSWKKEQNIELTLGHIGVKTDGSLLDLQTAVPEGHAVTTSIPADGSEKKFGEDTQHPQTLRLNGAQYAFAFYTLGTEDAVSTHVVVSAPPNLWIRYTENGQFEYSADQSTWHTWNSSGNDEKPVVYAVYTFACGENDHYVPVTVMAGTEGLLIDDTAAGNVFTYQYTVKEQKWKLEDDGNGTMTAVKDGEPVTVVDGESFTLHPNTINTILLEYTEVKDGDSTSDITTQSVEIVQTLEPSGYVKKTGEDFIKHQENGTSTGAGITVVDATYGKKFIFDTAKNGVTVSYGSVAGTYNMAVTTPPVGTDVEFCNVRETVKLKLAKILKDPSMAANETKDFTFTVRLRELHSHGEHVHMMGSYTIKGVKTDEKTYAQMFDGDGNLVSAIDVPKGVDVLIIEQWNSEDDRYDTTVTGAAIFREADREYIVENIQEDTTTVTYTNTLKPRTVTVVKELVNGDAAAQFSFSAVVTETVNGSVVPASGYPVYTDTHGQTVSTDNEGKVPFTITGNGEQALKIPVGATVTITETDPNTTDHKYTVSRKTGNEAYTEFTAGEAYAVTLTNVTQDQTVTFRNVETSQPVCQVIRTDGDTDTFVDKYTTLNDAFDAIRTISVSTSTDFTVEMLVERYNFGNASIMVDASDFADKNITITTAPEGENHPVTGAFTYRGASGTTATIVKDQTVGDSMFKWINGKSLVFKDITFDGGNISESNVNGGLIYITDGTVSFRNDALAEKFVTTGNGGVVYASGCRVDVKRGAELISNTAAQGGAIASSQASIYLLGGTITGNKATGSDAHGAVENLDVSGNSGIIVSGSPYVMDNTNGDGEKANIILSTDNNNELRVVGDLTDEAKLGIYSAYREHADEVFGMAAESEADNATAASSHYTGYYHFKNDRDDHLVGMEGTVPGIQWMGAIARVSNDGGNTWTYHDELISTQWVNQSDNHLHGAFNQATSYTGDVIVELLLESHPKYTIANDKRFTLDKANLSVTLRTTQDPGWNPGVMNGHGFTSTIYRGWNGGATATASLFYVNNAAAKLTTKDIIFDGSQNNTTKYTGRAVYVNAGELAVNEGSTFRNFSTDGNGGAVWAANITVSGTETDPVVFENCKATGNSVCGGAVYILNNAAAYIRNTSFTDCQAVGSKGLGGAIYNTEGASLTTLENVSITGSTANKGGAVYSAGNLTIKQTGTGTSEIRNCTAFDANSGAVQVASGKTMTFEGNVVIYDNKGTGTLASQQKNVVLDQDNNTTINTASTGLGSNARIGVYVTGTMLPAADPFKSHGAEGMPFGTYGKGVDGSYEGDYRYFINDRLSTPASGTEPEKLIRGVAKKVTDSTNIMYWEKTDVVLTITKTVDGAMGDTTKAFTFTVGGLTAGTVYGYRTLQTTDGTDYTATAGIVSDGAAAEGELTADSNGRITFRLKHNQKIELTLPADTAVEVTEQTDYYTMTCQAFETDSTVNPKTLVSIENLPEAASAGQDVTGAKLMAAKNTTLTVKNTLGAVSPTGVELRYAPFALLLLFGALLFLLSRRRKVKN